MPSEGCQLIHCYNRGCGQKFDPNQNMEDSCTYHPGAPFFHDAYKGWSCCKKKCTDFTEFLNIKGCTKSYHNNIKPPEPERLPVDRSKADEVVEYKAPAAPVIQALERPPFDSPLIQMKADVAAALVQQASSLKEASGDNNDMSKDRDEIALGTSCKNGGCKQVYEGPAVVSAPCQHHPGCPVFHEGLKFWSCCQRRTTDFNSFLEQAGCVIGDHVWIKDEGRDKIAKCRYDWHQTSNNVVVSVFAKKYDPERSSVHLNPIRLKVHLFFPEEDNSFDFDLELRGVIAVSESAVSMLPTKLEVRLRKAEPGSWSKLDFPSQTKQPETVTMDDLVPEVDAVDLSDL